MTAAAFAMAISAGCALGDDSAAPQRHDPSTCAAEDGACLRQSYDEYKEGILSEFAAYQELAPQIEDAAQRRNDLAAARVLNELIARKLYKHNHWKPLEEIQVADAGIDSDEFDVLWSNCRVAIVELKFIGVEVSSDRFAEALKDEQDYRDDAQACEQKFHLARAAGARHGR